MKGPLQAASSLRWIVGGDEAPLLDLRFISLFLLACFLSTVLNSMAYRCSSILGVMF